MTKNTVAIFREDRGFQQEYKNLLRMYNELIISHEELKMKHTQCITAVYKLNHSTDYTTPKGISLKK